jgi:hypothetical protein
VTARAWVGALLIFGLLAGGIGLTAALIFQRPPAAAPPPTVRQTVLPTVAPPPRIPTTAEFTIGVTVTDRRCDSGTCVYTYTVAPKYIGLQPLPDTQITVDYEVTGGRQPQPGTFTVTGDQARIYKDVTVEGPPGAVLAARPTRVSG